MTRTVTVFNDMLSGTSVQFSWSAHVGSPTGTQIASGSTTLTVPLAGRTPTTISFTAPSSGSSVYLTLATAENGTTIFSDSHEEFSLAATGSPGSTTIVGAQSGSCLDAYGNGTTNGTEIDIWGCSGGANQDWTVNANGTITGVQSRSCLDAYGNGTTNGTVVDLWTCNGGTNQQWKVNANGTITGVQSGLCLDVYGQDTANGSKVDLWTCNGGTNQEWN